MRLANLFLHVFSAFGMGWYTVFFTYMYLYSYLNNQMEPSTYAYLMTFLFASVFATSLVGGILLFNAKRINPKTYMLVEIADHSFSIIGYFALVVIGVVQYINSVSHHVPGIGKPSLNIDGIVFLGIAVGIAGIVVTVINYSKTKKRS